MSDQPAWHALDVAARTEYLVNLSASSIAETERAGVTTVLTGVFSNTLNGVCRARLDPADADAVIAATIARFQDRQAPALWYVDPSDAPDDLPRRLQAAGCRPDTTGVVHGGAVADLLARSDALAAAAERARAAAVRPVRSEADLDRWFDVARDVFAG